MNGAAVLKPDVEIDVTEQIQTALEESVQRLPEVTKEGGTNFMTLAGWRGTFLPAYGTRARQFALRDWYRADEQVLIRGAFTGVAKTVATLPWEIAGEDENQPDATVEYFQDVFRQSNFGGGWGQLIPQVVLDFLRYDIGVFIEVIGTGMSYEELTTPVTGIAHLDPLHCIPTGDPVFPVIYYDRWGGLHVMHYSRVICLQDMNDGDDLRPGYGDSALSRAISIAVRQQWETRYINAFLDDKPTPGLDIIGGIVKGEFERVERQFQMRQQTDQPGAWGNRMRYYTADPAIMPKVESIDFQRAPEKFDFQTYVNIDVDELALAMNVDRQELMQLQQGNMGSEAQSIILHQKSKGKTIGYLVTELERRLNDLLPDTLTFQFKYRDEQEAKEEAEKANIWADFNTKTADVLTAPQRQLLLANNIESVHDALQDAPRANDVDVMQTTPVVAADDTSGAETLGASTPTETPPPNVQANALKKTVKFNPNHGEGGLFAAGGGATNGNENKPDTSNDEKPQKPGRNIERKPADSKIEGKDKAALESIHKSPEDVIRHAGMGELPSELADKYPSRIKTTKLFNGDTQVLVEAGDPNSGFHMQREIAYDSDGNIRYVKNKAFFLPNKYQGTGEGTRIFSNQIDEIRSSVPSNGKYPEVWTTAGKGKGMNGYYTWGRLGYDTDIKTEPGWHIPSSVSPSGSDGGYRVSDFMKSSEGRGFWKENGYQTFMTFDTNPNSQSSQVLDAYMSEKSQKSYQMQKSDAPEGSFDIDVPPEDEKLLDSIWDEIASQSKSQKSYTVTESGFLQDVRSLMRSAVNRDESVGRYSFGIRMRNLIKDYGLRAFQDGLEQGGVTVDELDPEDEGRYQQVFVTQAQYVGGLSDDIYVNKAVTLNNVDNRASMWGKTLQAFLDSGQYAASKNGMFRWERDKSTLQSCVTCLRMDGQVHRMKAWYEKGILPRSSKLVCLGFQCKCRLVPTKEKARGRF